MRRDALTSIGHLATESLVIFLSIVLALLADDWRESRDLRARERVALELIAHDLEAEARELATYRDRLAREEEAAARFITFAAAGAAPVDSLVSAVQGALITYNYRPSHPSYRGVAQSGQLALIRDPGLRDAIVAYHDDRVAYLEDLQRNVTTLSDRSTALLQRHVTRRRGEDGGWFFGLVGSPVAVGGDVEALSALGHAAAARRWLRLRIDEVFVPENEALRAAVAAYLAG